VLNDTPLLESTREFQELLKKMFDRAYIDVSPCVDKLVPLLDMPKEFKGVTIVTLAVESSNTPFFPKIKYPVVLLKLISPSASKVTLHAPIT
jgi:hypothetical protein